jgi:hypothetical protein
MQSNNAQQTEIKQQQIFYADDTARTILKHRDLNGLCAIVVGASRGLGLEIAHSLASKLCHVIMACRNCDSAQSALNSILNENVSRYLI